jgi:hypothetical protein
MASLPLHAQGLALANFPGVPVVWIIVRLIAGLVLFGLGAFSAIMSPLITDSGTQEAIRAFEIVLCLSLLAAVLGIALMIWGVVGIFRH